MKRICATILTVMIITSALIIPSYAYDNSSFNFQVNWPQWSWECWFHGCILKPGCGDTEEPPTVEPVLDTPVITKATYTHNTSYNVPDNSLQIAWDSVDDATSYEVEIVKADGTNRTYTTSNTSLRIHAGDDDFVTGCLKIYNENTNTWESATVRVRALSEDAVSEWSDTKNISCNMIHTTPSAS